MTTEVAPAGAEQHQRVAWVPWPRVRIARWSLPSWAFVLLAYLASRVLTTGFLFAWWIIAHGWSIAHYDGGPGFLGFLQSWDVQWYQRVAEQGYPAQLPTDQLGQVTQNTWAFFPVFPAVVGAITAVTGLSFPIAGMIVATVFGALATLALHRMLLQHFRGTQALWGAVLFAFGPLSFLLQLAYAESMFLFFVFCAIAAMVSRRYWLMIPFALVASFTHPGALALAGALGLQGIVRLVRRHPIKWHEWTTAGAAILVIGAAALLWPVLAQEVTGHPNAYFDTELGWWRDFIGNVAFIPWTPFFLFYGGRFGWGGIAIVIIVFVAVAFWLTRRSTRALGIDVYTYTISYILYITAVFLPTESLLRVLLPLSPLLGHPGLSRTRRRRWITFGVSVFAQPVAILLLWVVYPP